MAHNTTETIWCISPVYFDFKSFSRLRSTIQSVLRESHPHSTVKFIIVDDSAGNDHELGEMSNKPDIVMVVPPYNLGHQRALVFGIRKTKHLFAENDVIITLDADGEDRPEDLPSLLQALPPSSASEAKNSIVLARRTSRKTSYFFKILYFFFQIFFRLLTGIVVRTGNMACYRAQAIMLAIGHPFFDQCYSSTLIALRFRRIFVPCPRGRRYFGSSKMNFWSLLVHGHRMLMPFIDRIAIRLLFFIAALFLATLVLLGTGLVAALFFNQATLGAFSWIALGLSGLCMVLLVNFLVLFTVVAQSQAISLRGIEEK